MQPVASFYRKNRSLSEKKREGGEEKKSGSVVVGFPVGELDWSRRESWLFLGQQWLKRMVKSTRVAVRGEEGRVFSDPKWLEIMEGKEREIEENGC
ncbi:hypothetical protein HAX54_047205 [Datura stramonium]|uniref:Uncharacterized protein n=1 Tax=Datura stramonium TaxID=4076 RepID=A0ABS8SS84_DATST|nr:hypothetical protein [Datura stramonium]